MFKCRDIYEARGPQYVTLLVFERQSFRADVVLFAFLDPPGSSLKGLRRLSTG